MDWLEQDHVMIDCLHMQILCTNSQGILVTIQGIPKKVSIRQTSSLQAKKCIRKGCKLFAVNIQDVEAEREKHIEEFSFLIDYMDIFPEEIPGLPLKRDLYFSIELAIGLVPASKSPYYMSSPELVELKL